MQNTENINIRIKTMDANEYKVNISQSEGVNSLKSKITEVRFV
jgi:hypothetical protein